MSEKILRNLEQKYAECPSELRTRQPSSENYRLTGTQQNNVPSHEGTTPSNDHNEDDGVLYSQISLGERPKMKTGYRGMFGKEVDAIEYLEQQLKFIDLEITEARKEHYSATPTAFVTMDSVANAQMAAQAVLDPRVHYFITRLAPAPHDIKWDHVCLSRKDRLTKVYSTTVFIGLSSLFLVIPVSYLATLLNLKTLSKFWPSVGKLLKEHQWAANIVTGLVPTYIFTLLNFVIPYFYEYLTSYQGLVSYSEEEISLVSKIFFIFLLIFS